MTIIELIRGMIKDGNEINDINGSDYFAHISDDTVYFAQRDDEGLFRSVSIFNHEAKVTELPATLQAVLGI